jgi:hypothetical protein
MRSVQRLHQDALLGNKTTDNHPLSLSVGSPTSLGDLGSVRVSSSAMAIEYLQQQHVQWCTHPLPVQRRQR